MTPLLNSNVAYGSGLFVLNYPYGTESQVYLIRSPKISKDFNVFQCFSL